jgi:branched-subunit amino acid transport protein AzlD
VEKAAKKRVSRKYSKIRIVWLLRKLEFCGMKKASSIYRIKKGEQTMNRVIMVLILILYGLDCIAQTTVEANIGSVRTGINVITFHYLDKNNKWSLYNSNRYVAYYDGSTKPGFLTVNSLAYNFKPGIGITGNLVGDNNRLYPSMGLQYEKIGEKLYFYLLSTYEVNKITLQENYLFIVYKYPLAKNLKLLSHNEFYASFLTWKNDLSLERIKLGIEVKNTQWGLISETYQSGKNYKWALTNIGCYIKRSF